jgi:hypothetical protein
LCVIDEHQPPPEVVGFAAMTRWQVCSWLVLTLTQTLAPVGCGAANDGVTGPADSKPAPPVGANDPAFSISGVRAWYLVGNALTAGHETLQIAVVAPAGVATIDLWIDDHPGVRLAATATDHRQVVDIAHLEPGEHEVLLAADGSDTAFARLTFLRSHPLYVLVSTDWDDPDNADMSLARQEQLHTAHEELRLTHFVGPYTFTDPDVAPSRVDILVGWLAGMRDTYDDEIGVHIHPYCSFVETAGVPCRTQPSFVYPAGDATGYTVVLASYGEAELATLLATADELLSAHGLGKPTSFRAGGWAADLSTLRALAAAGYVVDSSANNWARLEEWDGSPPGATLYEWNQEHWATIGDTSQPYYPSAEDILTPGSPHVGLLEVPDNGILVDYVTTEEMIDIFSANWAGGPLATPTVYQIGFHPPNFNEAYRRAIDDTLTHVDRYRASADDGPVVYATLSELVQVWPTP